MDNVPAGTQRVTRALPTTIGFVILSHGDQALLARLVSRLDQLYNNPPIACHHDFSQAPLDTAAFPGNVRFVQPSVATGWGKLSVVTAGLSALRLLVETADPDWFVLLSATDYPVRAAELVMHELATTRHDAFLDTRLVRGQTPGAATPDRRSESQARSLRAAQQHQAEMAILRRRASMGAGPEEPSALADRTRHTTAAVCRAVAVRTGVFRILRRSLVHRESSRDRGIAGPGRYGTSVGAASRAPGAGGRMLLSDHPVEPARPDHLPR